MNVIITSIDFEEDDHRIMVSVNYSEEVEEIYQSATVIVSLDWIDSYDEIKRQALDKAKTFLSHAASAR